MRHFQIWNLLFFLICFLIISSPGCGCGEPAATEQTEVEVSPDGKDASVKENHQASEAQADSGEPEQGSQKKESQPEKPKDKPKPNGKWIGDPCLHDNDCPYEGAFCLKEGDGFPKGTCSRSCTRLCPDQTGKAGTFCVDLKKALPGGAGACISQCNYSIHPQSGCRTGYHCAEKSRYKEETKRSICIPGKPPAISGCYLKLQKLGIQFAKASDPKQKPKGSTTQLCTVKDALRLSPIIHGVTWITGHNKALPIFASCQLALSIAKLSKYLKARGINKAMHFGTYSCRAIRTDSGPARSLSQHAYAKAIDIAAFWTTDGKEYSIVKYWDHSTKWINSSGQMGCWSKTFNTPQAKLLYEIACEIWKQKFFSLLLTPNYNKVHDNHFHADLSSTGRVLSNGQPANIIRKHNGHGHGH